jgi:hypothetical protein
VKKAAPLLVLLVLAVVGAWFLARKPSKSLRPDEPIEEAPTTDRRPPPSLAAAPAPANPRPAPAMVSEEPGEAPTAPEAGSELTGFVVDAESGKPIAGASVCAEVASEPCPRALLRPHPLLDGPDAAITGKDGRVYTARAAPIVATDKDGAFRIPWDRPDASDLFVKAAGHVLAVSCRATTAAPVTIRLDKGLSIEGVVVTRDDKPIAGAKVSTMPAPGTPPDLGHEEFGITTADGKFALSGLVAGAVVVRADQFPAYMPTASEPMEPGRRDVKLVLVPAFVVSFELKTDDGRAPETPTVAWTTTGTPPKRGLQLLQALRSASGPIARDVPIVPSPPAGDASDWEPVRLAADRPTVRFEVKAVGYSTWTSEAIEIPPEGGATTVSVELRRDPNLGRLIVRLEDKDGKPLSYVDEKVAPMIWRRDGQTVGAGIVLKPGETLELPALPSGPYGIVLRSPAHAPVTFDKIDVAAGRDTEVRAALGPPAKVRVKFTSVENTMVKFQLAQGKEVVLIFPELPPGATPPLDGAAAAPSDGSVVAGAEGILLSGLATGRYAIEVLSPELTAPPTSVDLVEGDTKEVEIRVSKR